MAIDTVGEHGRIFIGGGGNFCPLGGVITQHRAVKCSVSVSNCAICILPLLLSYIYDDKSLWCAATSNIFKC